MLINVKMPTDCWHFNIYEQDKFCAVLEYENVFITSGPVVVKIIGCFILIVYMMVLCLCLVLVLTFGNHLAEEERLSCLTVITPMFF